MPKNTKLSSSTKRRHATADHIALIGTERMRKCTRCAVDGAPCIVSELSDSCERCYRTHRSCELSAPWSEVQKVLAQSDKLDEQILESQAKILRLRKQKRALVKKLKELGAREEQNVFGLEQDEQAAASTGAPSVPASEFDFSVPVDFPWNEEMATLLDSSSGGTVV